MPSATARFRSHRRKPSRRSALPSLFARYSCFAPAEELDEVRRVEPVPDAEIRLGRDPRELVPGADELAVVASEDPVADRGSQRLGNRAVVLDREVGNAAARIELVGRRDRAGRAGGQAGAAAAAAVRRARVYGERQVGEQFAEHEERAGALVDEVRVLADPAKAGIARERLLHDGRRIDERAVAERADFGFSSFDASVASRPRSTLW